MLSLLHIKRDCINKNLIISYFLSDYLNCIFLNINLLNLLKLNKDIFLRGISLLELLTNQKAFVTSKRIILNSRIKQNIFNISFIIVLRKDVMLNFLSYLNCFVFSEMRHTYSFYNYNG